MSKKIILNCKNCSSPFSVLQKEYNRQIKNGRASDHFFCSISCSTSWANSNIKWSDERRRAMSKSLIGNNIAKKGDFTWYLSQVRSRHPDHDLDEEFLRHIWDTQEGRCAASNVPLKIRRNSNSQRMTPDTASLDRKDSNRGYTRDNVQFLAYTLNLGKNSFSDEELSEFINLMKQEDSSRRGTSAEDESNQLEFEFDEL